MEAFEKEMRKGGHGKDAETLSWFAKIGLMELDGSPKPALEIWDGFRK